MVVLWRADAEFIWAHERGRRAKAAALDGPAGCGSVQGGWAGGDLQALFPLMVIWEKGKVEAGAWNTCWVAIPVGIGMRTVGR
jgi:hypothetical protein